MTSPSPSAAQTDTLDLEGKVIATSDHLPTLAEIEAVLPRFTGPIEQVPPAYSALKVDGKRAYDLARAGEEVELKTRAVTVFALEVKRKRALIPTFSRMRERGSRAHDVLLPLSRPYG